MNGLSKQEYAEVVIVVFLADFDLEYKKQVENTLRELFSEEVKDGLIHVAAPPRAYYPNFNSLPLFFHDSVARVYWRSKQSLDYSFLYFHSAELGKYFMQLEDDVTTEKNFLPEIKKFINSRKTPWSTLEFGARGFIGMLYDAKNLLPLAKYCRINYFLVPVDWLFRLFNDIWLYGNQKDSIRKPPLFKHVGIFSTLDGQVRKLEDIKKGPKVAPLPKFFQDADNPPAVLSTTVTGAIDLYPIANAYLQGMFWGKTAKPGDTVTMVFQKPISLKRVAFLSGTPDFPLDSFEDGEIFVSIETNGGACETFTSIFKFSSTPILDVKDVSFKDPIKCIKLRLDTIRKDPRGKSRWLIIREIDIWINK